MNLSLMFNLKLFQCSDTWSSVSHMSHRRSEVVMSNVDDTLVVFGGYQVSEK